MQNPLSVKGYIPLKILLDKRTECEIIPFKGPLTGVNNESAVAITQELFGGSKRRPGAVAVGSYQEPNRVNPAGKIPGVPDMKKPPLRFRSGPFFYLPPDRCSVAF